MTDAVLTREMQAANEYRSAGRARHERLQRNAQDNHLQHQQAASVSRWTAVCRLDDIVPNTGVCALVSGHQVAVFRVDDDRVYAIGNHDPFSRANVLSRGIVGDIRGELVVASPVYKQHFSLASGHCVEDVTVRVPVFAARVDGDTVFVRIAESDH